jgi:HTH-type transcriptional regulator / antitoxin HipB
MAVRDDLDKYIQRRKKTDKAFAAGYEDGYQELKIGTMLRSARKQSGITQDELARRLRTTKSAISRIENHAEDIRLSTLKKVAEALGKELRVAIS